MTIEKNALEALLELTLFSERSKPKNTQDMSEAKKQSISILIELEQIFPPAFFDIMSHVAIHLPDEAILGGPIRYRWMFPFERYTEEAKEIHVRNKAKPEGSIAGGVLLQ
ncbi:hypothetical protein Tco_0890469 [Tanacetum coccineum]|uniref:DUF4218 domain-containing protein n=1 Tax=Tanacetum coccineum TaxID=301880 RepID=A0ABQ5C3G2_9ASTR